MPDEPHDPYPDLIAEVDQAVATAPEIARFARALFDAFIKEGFTESQALQMTIGKLNV